MNFESARTGASQQGSLYCQPPADWRDSFELSLIDSNLFFAGPLDSNSNLSCPISHQRCDF